MPLTELNLSGGLDQRGDPIPTKITGKRACAWRRAAKCCLRATLGFGRIEEGSSRSSPHAFLAPPGDIAALQNMPLTELNLLWCDKLTGRPGVRMGVDQ